jgi:hypothetical protein
MNSALKAPTLLHLGSWTSESLVESYSTLRFVRVVVRRQSRRVLTTLTHSTPEQTCIPDGSCWPLSIKMWHFRMPRDRLVERCGVISLMRLGCSGTIWTRNTRPLCCSPERVPSPLRVSVLMP